MENEFDLKNIRLIVGLGNIGRQYNGTRHNIGFDFLERLASKHVFTEDKKFKAMIEKYEFNGNTILLAKPTTLMNSSGEAVRLITDFYKFNENEILIIHDDLDLSLGKYKIQLGVGPKIHNGILSIENRLGTAKFWRLRLGVDNRDYETRKNISGSDYVLGKFRNDEMAMVDEMFMKIIEEIVF